jgi:hypothetical protein
MRSSVLSDARQHDAHGPRHASQYPSCAVGDEGREELDVVGLELADLEPMSALVGRVDVAGAHPVRDQHGVVDLEAGGGEDPADAFPLLVAVVDERGDVM